MEFWFVVGPLRRHDVPDYDALSPSDVSSQVLSTVGIDWG